MCYSLLWAITGHLFMMVKFLRTLFSSVGEESHFSWRMRFDPCPLASVAKMSVHYQTQKYFWFPNTIKFSHFTTVKCINGRGKIRQSQKITTIAISVQRRKDNILEDNIFWKLPVPALVEAEGTMILPEYSKKCSDVLLNTTDFMFYEPSQAMRVQSDNYDQSTLMVVIPIKATIRS